MGPALFLAAYGNSKLIQATSYFTSNRSWSH